MYERRGDRRRGEGKVVGHPGRITGRTGRELRVRKGMEGYGGYEWYGWYDHCSTVIEK